MKRNKRKYTLRILVSFALSLSILLSGWPSVLTASASEIGKLEAYNDNGITTEKIVESNGNCGFVFPTIDKRVTGYEDISSLKAEISTDNGTTYEPLSNVYTYTNTYVDGAGKQFGYWNYQIPGGDLLVGFWLQQVTESTKVRISAVDNPKNQVVYTMTLKNPKSDSSNKTVKSFEAFTGDAASTHAGGTTTSDGLTVYVNDDGGIGIKLPGINGGSEQGGTSPGTNYSNYDDDIKKEIKINDTWYEWGTPESGLIWNSNYGWWDGGGFCGYWFNPITQTTQIRLSSKTTPDVNIIYTLAVKAARKNNNLHIFEGESDTTTTGEATTNINGMVEIASPFVGETKMTKDEAYNTYIREISRDHGKTWESVTNGQDNPTYKFGYSLYSKSKGKQAGIREDNTNKLWYYWLAPVTEELLFRISDPTDTENCVIYKIHANENITLPDDVSVLPHLDQTGEWEKIWSDEFEGNVLNRDNWDYATGFFINEDPGTWGWGNNEYEWYSDSEHNVSVNDGNLNISIFNEPKSVFQVGKSTLATDKAKYSSGKIITKGKFSYKYGRIDFRAKLPSGTGLWPAMWLLPADDAYGGWASSGEIDVLEARGRIPSQATGAIHFGGSWPENKNIGGEYTFPNNGRIDDGYHIYSLTWEKEKLVWYVDGVPYFYADMDEWYTNAAADSQTAPFDQKFYIIINLAAGGWFDGALDLDQNNLATINQDGTITAPKNGGSTPTMLVDYVRVYQHPDNKDFSVDDKRNTSIDSAPIESMPNASVSGTDQATQKIQNKIMASIGASPKTGDQSTPFFWILSIVITILYSMTLLLFLKHFFRSPKVKF